MIKNPAIDGEPISEEVLADIVASFAAWSVLHPDSRIVSGKLLEKYGKDPSLSYLAAFLFGKTLALHEMDQYTLIGDAFELVDAEVAETFEEVYNILYKKNLKSLKERKDDV